MVEGERKVTMTLGPLVSSDLWLNLSGGVTWSIMESMSWKNIASRGYANVELDLTIIHIILQLVGMLDTLVPTAKFPRLAYTTTGRFSIRIHISSK